MKKILNVPYIAQSIRSSNCAPCSVQMMLEYYKIDKINNKKISTQSLNRQLKVSKKWGCQEKDIETFLKKNNIHFKKVSYKKISSSLSKKKPLLVLFEDEVHDGHYAILIGEDQNSFFFHDPWPEFGREYKRNKKKFFGQLKVFNCWMISLEVS